MMKADRTTLEHLRKTWWDDVDS